MPARSRLPLSLRWPAIRHHLGGLSCVKKRRKRRSAAARAGGDFFKTTVRPSVRPPLPSSVWLNGDAAAADRKRLEWLVAMIAPLLLRQRRVASASVQFPHSLTHSLLCPTAPAAAALSGRHSKWTPNTFMPQRLYLPKLPNREKFCEIFFGFSLLSENRGEEAADRREETEEGREGLREALSGGGRRFSGGCRMGNIRRVRPPVVARMGRCCTWMEDPLFPFLWMMSGQMGGERGR